jgi:predicted small lipoprotein YifL
MRQAPCVFAAAISFACLLAACGQTGALYLPDTGVTTPVEIRSAPATPPAEAATPPAGAATPSEAATPPTEPAPAGEAQPEEEKKQDTPPPASRD